MLCTLTSGWIFDGRAFMALQSQNRLIIVRGVSPASPMFSYTLRLASSPLDQRSTYRCIREKSFFMGLGVTGTGRVSGASAEWEMYVLVFIIHVYTRRRLTPPWTTETARTRSPLSQATSICTPSILSSLHRMRGFLRQWEGSVWSEGAKEGREVVV